VTLLDRDRSEPSARSEASRPRPARALGVEHEFVIGRAGEIVDFRTLVHDLEGHAVHPVDRDWLLTPSGGAVIADGLVGEVATPPITIAPGFTADVEAHAFHGALEVRHQLPDELTMEGGSTHISVSVDPAANGRGALLYASTFAPSMMLLIDRADSPGLLVRPRPGRLELGGEYVAGDALRAAVAFAAASATAVERHLLEGFPIVPRFRTRLELARRRFGYYVDRRAFGDDIYELGRATALSLEDGSSIVAQQALEQAWEVVRPIADEVLADDELALVEAVVMGAAPLPLEGADQRPGDAVPSSQPIGRALTPPQRPGIELSLVAATWDWVAFDAESRGCAAVVLVPRAELASFEGDLAGGRLDRVLEDEIGAASGVLEKYAQTRAFGVYASARFGDPLMPRDRAGIGSGSAIEVNASTGEPIAGSRTLAATTTRSRATSTAGGAALKGNQPPWSDPDDDGRDSDDPGEGDDVDGRDSDGPGNGDEIATGGSNGWWQNPWAWWLGGGLVAGVIIVILILVLTGGSDTATEVGDQVASGDQVDIDDGQPDEATDGPGGDPGDPEPEDPSNDGFDQIAECDGGTCGDELDGFETCDAALDPSCEPSVDDCEHGDDIGCGENTTGCAIGFGSACATSPEEPTAPWTVEVTQGGNCGWPAPGRSDGEAYLWPDAPREGDPYYNRSEGWALLLGTLHAPFLQFDEGELVAGIEPRGDEPLTEWEVLSVVWNDNTVTIVVSETRYDDGVPCTQQMTYVYTFPGGLEILDWMESVPGGDTSDVEIVDATANYTDGVAGVDGQITGGEDAWLHVHMECSGDEIVYAVVAVTRDADGNFEAATELPDCVVVNMTLVANGTRIAGARVSG
jgi:hypothetical protein